MSFLSSLFGRGSPTPRLYDTDEVQPMHVLDDVKVLAGYDLFWTFPFKEVLDADVLGRALCELIEMGEWRRLGGRYRRNAAGRTELHIPTPFTPSRPPVYFTKDHFDQNMEDHPIASQLPVAGKTAQIYPQSRVLVPLAYGPGAPRNIQERLERDVPQIGLHVVTFRNGTFVSFTWNHIMCDLGGFSAIVKGWVAHLHGQPVPDFMSTEDAMRHLYTNPPQDVKLIINEFLLSGWRKAFWVAQFLWDQWWTTASFALQQVCIPKERMDALYQRCKDDAAKQAAEWGGDSFISEGDIIMALGTRAAAMSLPKGTWRSITTLGAVNARAWFPDVYSKEEAYVQNMSLGVCHIQPAREILETKIGALALSLRRDLEEQLTDPQMRKTSAVVYDTAKSTGMLPMVGDATSYLSSFSNWSKAKLLETMDLGPAIVSEERQTRKKTAKKALPVSFHSKSVEPGNYSTAIIVIRGRDHNGDMWLEGECAPEAWQDMMDYINVG